MPALIGEDSGGCSTQLACRGLLQGSDRLIDNQVYHGYTITDKSDEGQDASSRIEMGNVGLKEAKGK